MSEPPYATVKSHPRFETGWNRLQTVIQIFVTGVVAAGLLGLLGSGPMSAAHEALRQGNISIDYERILRRTLQTDMTITLASVPANGRIEIELPGSFVHEMDVATTSPRATQMRMQKDGVIYAFDTSGPDGGAVTLSLKPRHWGLVTSKLTIDREPVALRQLVLP